jgi:hypothetical protein
MKDIFLIAVGLASWLLASVIALLIYGGIFGVIAAGAWLVFKAIT